DDPLRGLDRPLRPEELRRRARRLARDDRLVGRPRQDERADRRRERLLGDRRDRAPGGRAVLGARDRDLDRRRERPAPARELAPRVAPRLERLLVLRARLVLLGRLRLEGLDALLLGGGDLEGEGRLVAREAPRDLERLAADRLRGVRPGELPRRLEVLL